MPSVHVIITSPRVAPGLLTASAWALVAGPTRVGAPELDDPLAAAVRQAGVDVAEVADPTTATDDLVWLAPHGDTAWTHGVAAAMVERDAADVEVVHGSYDLPGARLLDLVEVMDRLRQQCPWDREQTHESLARYLLEEAYETLEAIDAGDRDHLREELGDLLLQVLFHSRIAAEGAEDPWDVDDVAGDIVDKLVRRHPRVFGDADAADADQVSSNWETIKAAEKGRTSVLDGISPTLPALARADKLLERLDQAGLTAVEVPDDSTPAGRIGVTILDVVRRAREAGIDPEQALRATLTRYGEAVQAAERSRD